MEPASLPCQDEITGNTVQPRSYRLIAYGFLFVGVLSCFDFVYEWLLFGRVNLNLNCATLFIGWGLFRQKFPARELALFTVWLCILGMLIAAAAVWIVDGQNLQFSIGQHRFKPSFLSRVGFFFFSMACLYMLWSARNVLSSTRVKELFTAAYNHGSQSSKQLRYRFSIGNLLFVMAVIAFIAARIGLEAKLQQTTIGTNNLNGSAVLLEVGTLVRSAAPNSDPELAYLVIGHGSPGTQSLVNVHHERPTGTLRPPGKLPIELPSKTQIFEWRDGKLYQSEVRISYAEFEKLEQILKGRWSLENLELETKRLRGATNEQLPGK